MSISGYHHQGLSCLWRRFCIRSGQYYGNTLVGFGRKDRDEDSKHNARGFVDYYCIGRSVYVACRLCCWRRKFVG